MALTTSTISENLFPTVTEESDLDLTLQLMNDANTTLYAVEFTNPNTTGVYVRHIWAASISGLNTSTQYDMCYYIPASSSFSLYCGPGFAVTGGVIFWASTETGTNSLNAPPSAVKVKVAYKDT